jgi:hypothetical protein
MDLIPILTWKGLAALTQLGSLETAKLNHWDSADRWLSPLESVKLFHWDSADRWLNPLEAAKLNHWGIEHVRLNKKN